MEEEGPICKTPQSARLRRLHPRRLKTAAAGEELAKRICSAEENTSTSTSPSATSSSPTSSSPSSSESEETNPPCVSHGWVSVIGRRREMEDAVSVEPGFFGAGEYDFYAVYDGHGGAIVAEVCKEKMHFVVAEEADKGEKGEGDEEKWRRAMAASFERVDGEVAEEKKGTVGSTAVVAVVGRRRIVVANCGDSRAVLSRGGVAVALSDDHKPNRPDEMKRVEAAGGRIINWDGYRVLGVLSTSRSIEITVTERSDKDEFLILASDGLWDAISNEVACRIVRQCLSGQAAKMFPGAVNGRSAAEAAALLAELAIARGSKDNISIVVVELTRTIERCLRRRCKTKS
ncbi:protein phosphatase 2C 51-like isoform X2 [Dendrobium catenatum]|uniref:protein phosphatase 2C 51-like isoform X2 n=1 Tax=Dendrobium catenatum TaxID=906689 RepID=UPI0010A076C0|nr:protein phosphatase 2C 51-like isoform X2 [Dendrobium catenatum]